jgi:hypothetical protein
VALKKRPVELKISLMWLKYLLDEVDKRPDEVEKFPW